MRVTLSDVAKKVGVSAKTVSNVVNGTGWVSDAVRDRVLAAIDELGYRPNIAARQLRTGKTGMLALGIPNLREPYFAELASDIVDRAHDQGVTVLITQTGGIQADERAFISGTGLPSVDGLILSPLSLTREDLQDRASQAPLVLVGEHGASIRTDTSRHVGIDNVAAARRATEFLIAHGRTRIAVVGVQHTGSTETSRLRFRGYVEALEAAGIPLDQNLLGDVPEFTRGDGSNAMDRIIESGAKFDAVFCFNDTLAFGALYSLAVHGVRVPEDVEVMGFDDIDEGRFSLPRFSTVNARTDLTAKFAIDMLTGKGNAEQQVIIPFEIVNRAPDDQPGE